jgi:hypothetical protein
MEINKMAIEIRVVKTVDDVNIVGIHNTNGIDIYNLTPHDIVLDNGIERIVYSKNDINVRVQEGYVDVENDYGLPFEKEDGNKIVTGLPEEEGKVLYIVSTMVRKELPNRKDLISPTTNVAHQERNEKGWTLSVSHFQTNL